MIDFEKEHLITFQEAARILPHGRNGKATHVATIHRWSANGCRGIYLDWVQLGGQKYTSKEALGRFIADLTRQANPRASSDSPKTLNQRDRRIADAKRQLDASGA